MFGKPIPSYAAHCKDLAFANRNAEGVEGPAVLASYGRERSGLPRAGYPLCRLSIPEVRLQKALNIHRFFAVAASVITVNNLIQQFGRFAALRGVTAEFAGGRLHAVLGENGAGKTTLLRALAGLAAADARRDISIFGRTRSWPVATSAIWRIPRCSMTR